jgi:hypothetical protein
VLEALGARLGADCGPAAWDPGVVGLGLGLALEFECCASLFGVWSTGVGIGGGVVMLGTGRVITDGVLTDGVLTVGVLTGPTVTEGTVAEGTVTDGTLTVGTVTVGTLIVGTEAAEGPTATSSAPQATSIASPCRRTDDRTSHRSPPDRLATKGLDITNRLRTGPLRVGP